MASKPRPYYIIDLEFQNIKKIYIYFSELRENSDLVAVRYYILLDRPAQCSKVYPY